ncbi:PfkB family carbohydrate kinase [Pseudonocardia dioxanivorans]|uniref:PfkB family carbohydrate kinase n=1 Tax=Pseudonocardia dioxanivorans TaxID=240495 RepID=UPI000CD2A673|nr:PfkB family carbohydrate kinase [Pseudonocardia dioxanivorans]
MIRPVVVVGDALLDVDVDGRVERTSPDSGVPVLDVTGESARPGGAGLAAALLASSGVPVVLVCAVDDDEPALRLGAALAEASVMVVGGPGVGGTAVKTRWRTASGPLLRTDRGSGSPAPGFGAAVRDALGAVLGSAAAVLVSDYGRGVASDRQVRAMLAAAAARGTPLVWDPHPRGGPPLPGTSVATPNAAEAARIGGRGDPAADGAELLRRWGCGAVAVTTGAAGAVLVMGTGRTTTVPAPPTTGDTCGAGDAFAGTLAAALAGGLSTGDAVADAVAAATAYVGAGGPASWRRDRTSVPARTG